MNTTYLTTEELSARIKYDSRTIRERLKDSVLLEGVLAILRYIDGISVTDIHGRLLDVWQAHRRTTSVRERKTKKTESGRGASDAKRENESIDSRVGATNCL